MDFARHNSFRRSMAVKPKKPEANRIKLPGSGTVPVVVVEVVVEDSEPRTVNDSE